MDACRPCISLIESTNENTFLVYDGLMALTNLASVSDSVRERIVREGGSHHVEYQVIQTQGYVLSDLVKQRVDK